MTSKVSGHKTKSNYLRTLKTKQLKTMKLEPKEAGSCNCALPIPGQIPYSDPEDPGKGTQPTTEYGVSLWISSLFLFSHPPCPKANEVSGLSGHCDIRK